MNKIIHGDCFEKLRELDDNSVDAVITDPPYGIGFMGKEWDTFKPEVVKSGVKRSSRKGFSNPEKMTAGRKGASPAWETARYDLSNEGNMAFQRFTYEWCVEALRVLKPGGHLLSCCGTRTYHRMAAGIEDAGFEIRDIVAYVYGSGFPKSLNIEKALSKYVPGTTQEPEHNLRSLQENDLSEEISNRKTEGQILQSSLSKQNPQEQGQERAEPENAREKQPSMERRSNPKETKGKLQRCPLCEMPERISGDGTEGRLHNGTSISDGAKSTAIVDKNRGSSPYRPQPEQQSDFKLDAICDKCRAQAIRRYRGFGTALKPAMELWTLARKPLSENTVAANVLKWRTGGLNIDGNRVVTEDNLNGGAYSKGEYDTDGKVLELGLKRQEGQYEQPLGRWPANLIHDGGEEVTSLFPDSKGWSAQKHNSFNPYGGNSFKKSETQRAGFHEGYNDEGSAARFFYTAKASKSERNKGLDGFNEETVGDGRPVAIDNAYQRGKTARQNIHPTVKPLALMRYLCKLITPPNGIILDPFTGSGTTGIAAKLEGFNFIGIEREKEYVNIAEARIQAWEPDKQQVLL